MFSQFFTCAVVLGLVASMDIEESFHGLEHHERINQLSKLSISCYNCVISGNHWLLYANLTESCEPDEQIAIGLPNIFIFSFHSYSCMEMFDYFDPLDDKADEIAQTIHHLLKSRTIFIGIFLVLICIGLLVGGLAQTPLVIRSNPKHFMALNDADSKGVTFRNGESFENQEQLELLLSEEAIELTAVCIHPVPKGLHV